MALKLTAAGARRHGPDLPRHDPLFQEQGAAIVPQILISKHEEAEMMVGGIAGPAEY